MILNLKQNEQYKLLRDSHFRNVVIWICSEVLDLGLLRRVTAE